MRFEPFERWVTLREAPDLHQDTEATVHIGGEEKRAIEKAVSYSRRKAEPNTGRWFRVVSSSPECPPYFGAGAPVMCNLSMLSDNLTIGDETVSLMPFSQCAGIRIGEETMKAMHARHPIVPVGDYVLCVDNDEKHHRILGIKSGSTILTPLMTLERGQRTDEQYEGEDNPNRENDGVKMLFTEVVMVGPEVPQSRNLEPGDMVAFRPNICGIRFDLFGVSYRLVRSPEKNSEIVGRVPRAEFE